MTSLTDDEQLLRLATAHAGTKRALSHLPRVTPALVRQLAYVPMVIRRPALLTVLLDHVVDADQWQALAEDLEAAGPQQRATLVRLARTVANIGELWDLFHLCRSAAIDARPPIELGPPFEPLRTRREQRAEGTRMRHCLGRATNSFGTQSAYFAWRGAERATVELMPVGDGWRLRRFAGEANAPVSPDTAAAIRTALGPQLCTAATVIEPRPAAYAAVLAVGRQFAAADQVTLAAALWSIHQRFLGPANAAFAILSSGELYVQCLARPDSEYLVEISSHHCVPAVAAHLTSAAVRVIDSAGFSWPRGEANFARLERVATADDAAELAAFLLGMLRTVFGVADFKSLRLVVHQPG